MASFADLLASAFAEEPALGQVFWITNRIWELSLYEGAETKRHPVVICCSKSILAPGTISRRAGRTKFGGAFALHGKSSTFLLEWRKVIPLSKFVV